MVNFGNSKIYKIVNDVDDEIYIGSTTMTLSKRMSCHRDKCKINGNRKIYSHMNSVGINHFRVILLEKFPCESKDELLRKEDEYIQLHKPTLNSINAKFDRKESLRKRRDQINAGKRIYYQNNKDKILLKQAEKIQCVCGSSVSKVHKQRHEETLKHITYIQNN